MKKLYYDLTDGGVEVIEILIAISKVSARTARNMAILARQSQLEKGEKCIECDEQYGYDY